MRTGLTTGTPISGLSPFGSVPIEVWDRVSATAVRIHREAGTHRRPEELRSAARSLTKALNEAGIKTENKPSVPKPRGSLTGREQQVLTHISEGRSNVEIAAELFVSEDTVKSHAKRLYRKLGARDRAHAVAIGFRAGVLS